MNVREYFSKSISLLLPKQKRSIILLSIFTVFVGLLEILSISIFLPFLNFMSSKGQAEFTQLQTNYKFLVDLNFEQFLVILGGASIFLTIFSNIFRILVTLFTARIVTQAEAQLSTMAIRSILSKPYSWFQDKDIKELYKFPLSEASHLVSVCFYPFINLITSSIIMLMLMISALIVNATIVILVGFLIGSTLIIYFIITKKIIDQNAVNRGEANNAKYVLATDIITSHKEIKLYNAEAYFIKRYFNLSRDLAASQAFIQVVGNLPRYIIEATLIVVAIILMLVSFTRGADLQHYIPLIGFFAVFVLRALPHAQMIFNSMNQIKYAKPALQQFTENVNISLRKDEEFLNDGGFKTQKLIFKNYEKMANNRDNKILSVDSLSIECGEKIAIIGASGSGKSTLLNAICGFDTATESLRYLDEDCHFIGNEQHNENIAFVPQEILHTSASIRENLSLGDPKVTEKNMISALEAVQLWSVIKKYPKKLDEKLYGQTVKLSGGQLQRLCIARALVKEREWLILDEPFAALDPNLEIMLINKIFNEYCAKTIILSTHRFENLHRFDRIFYMAEGTIKLIGNHIQLLQHPDYKKYVMG